MRDTLLELVMGYPLAMIVALVVVLLTVYLFTKRGKYPPGPTYIPGIGVIPELFGNMDGPHNSRWAKEYNSDIISYRVLGQRVVVLCTLKLTREMFSKRTELIHRLKINQFSLVEPNHQGIVFTDGDIWKESRRVTLQKMRSLGMGKSNAEEFIVNEGELLVAEFQKLGGEAFDPVRLLNVAVANIISQFIFGKRFEYSDTEFQQYTQDINNFVRVSISPSFFILRTTIGKLLMSKTLKKLKEWWTNIVDNFIQQEIDEHEQNFNGEADDLVDAFLLDRTKGIKIFHPKQIRSVVIDMFGAGSDTTMVLLQWLLLYMAEHQDVQERVYEELQQFEEHEAYAINNKLKTPYTAAVISEVMRNRVLFDAGPALTNHDTDFEIGGYLIPKGTAVMADYYGIQLDPTVFKNPDLFDPQHFLNDKGELINQDKLAMFGIGRRACAGESLARAEIYLFFTMVIRKFCIKAPEGCTVDLEPRKGSGPNQPNDFSIRLIPRV